MPARLLGAKQRFNKERFQAVENLRCARCSPLPFVISKVLAARMRKLISARARRNKRTARMRANARKDHSIPLIVVHKLLFQNSLAGVKCPRQLVEPYILSSY